MHSFLTLPLIPCSLFFFFNDTATTEIYTLSLHDALPIFGIQPEVAFAMVQLGLTLEDIPTALDLEEGLAYLQRSEEHTSELQSPCNLVCRLLLEKKKSIIQRLSLHISYVTLLLHATID